MWQFLPDFEDEGGRGRWTCIYDVASNGNTLEALAFRHDGRHVLSKSAGANIRLWNLESFETDPGAKPGYEDIPDSAMLRSFHGDYVFGGVYDLRVFNHQLYSLERQRRAGAGTGLNEEETKDQAVAEVSSSPVTTVRTSYILPECVVEWESGMRKKR